MKIEDWTPIICTFMWCFTAMYICERIGQGVFSLRVFFNGWMQMWLDERAKVRSALTGPAAAKERG